MAWRFVDGKLLFVDGKAVTNDYCCCGMCVEDCNDTSISVTLPAFTPPDPEEGCGDCGDISAGPWTLDAYTPGSPAVGSCYWHNLTGGGDVDSIEVELNISGTDPTKIATLTITVECAGGTIHEFFKEYQLCDLCTYLPGSVPVDPIGGECETSDPASIEFTTACCYVSDCDCPHHACDDDTEFNVNITGTGDWSFIDYDETVSADCVTYGELGSDGVNPVVAIGVKHTFEKTVAGCPDPIKIIIEMYLLCNATSASLACIGRKNVDIYFRITAYQQSCEAIVAQIAQGSIGQLEGCDSCWSREYQDIYGDMQPVEACLASNSPVAWVASVGTTLKWSEWDGSCSTSIEGILTPDDGGALHDALCSDAEIANCEPDDNFD